MRGNRRWAKAGSSCRRRTTEERETSGPQWLHEVKLDGYRTAAHIDNGHAQLLTRTGLDWTGKYPSAVAALGNLNVKTAYHRCELCGVDKAGLPSFAQTQAAKGAIGNGPPTDNAIRARRLIRTAQFSTVWIARRSERRSARASGMRRTMGRHFLLARPSRLQARVYRNESNPRSRRPAGMCCLPRSICRAHGRRKDLSA